MKKRLLTQTVLGLLLTGFGFGACLPPPPVPRLIGQNGKPVPFAPPTDERDEDAADALKEQIDALQSSDATSARALERELLESYPGSEAAADIYFSRAKAAGEEGRLTEAADAYARILLYHPHYENVTAVRVEYGKLCMELGRHDEAMNTFHFLYAGAEVPAEIDALARLYAQSLVENGSEDQALELMIDRRNNASLTMNERSVAEEEAYAIATGHLNFEQTERLWKRYRTNPGWEFVNPVIAFKLAKLYYHTRDYERSEELLQLFTYRYPNSKYGQFARTFYQRLQARFKVSPKTIGVLLPISGRLKGYGERSLQAIRQALAKDYELVVKDTKGDPTVAAHAVEELVLEDHVIAIIGPLSSKTALPAALKAEELSVPLLSLSHRKGIPETGPFVFRAALTIKAQAQALAKTAFETLGMSKFAILYPRSSYGKSFANAFWDEVNLRKGEIRGYESYEHDQTTFREPVQKLVGRWHRNSRPDYLTKREEIISKKLAPHRTQAKLEKMEKNLPPLVDFDAIVIPDKGRNIGLIAPALAFEDIVMTRDPKTLRRIQKATGNEEIHPVTLLGASTWNSPQILRSCDRYCENAIFVDGYYSDNPSPKVRDFISAFREANGAKPNLSDAQAFDTAGFLRWVLDSSAPQTREALQHALIAAGKYEGVTGKFSFDKSGEADKSLFTLTIVEQAIRLYKKPPEAPSKSPSKG